MKGRLRERVSTWKREGFRGEVLGWVEEGVKCVWEGEPRRGGRENKVEVEQVAFVVGEMERFRRMGVLKRVKRRPEVVMPLVVVGKGGECECKKWRLCVDGRELNEVMAKGRVRMEGLREVRHVVRKGDWLVKIDLKDFYLHFDLAEGEERRWGVEFGGAWWVFGATVFGFKRSAEVAARVSQEIVRKWRRKYGVRAMVWVDDFLLAFGSREEAEEGGRWARRYLEKLGFVVSEKSCLVASQKMEYLGLVVDTMKGELGVGEEKRKGVVDGLKQMVEGKVRTARELARVVGRVRSCSMG